LGRGVGEIVLSSDQDRRLDKPVGNGLSKWIAVDDLVFRRPGMRRRGEANLDSRTEIRHSLREGTAPVRVCLVREDNEIVRLLQALVERRAQALLKLVRALSDLARRAHKRLDGEDIELDFI